MATLRLGLLGVSTLLMIGGFAQVAAPPAHAAEPPPRVSCDQPDASTSFERRDPADLGLDPAAVADAIGFAQQRARSFARIFRHGCLVGETPLVPLTERVPAPIFSATKSTVSILTGIAEGDRRLGLDDPIGRHLPDGLGDAAHRAITIRNLLTEVSGLDEAISAESTAGIDVDAVKQALALPIEDTPGTKFRYNQRAADLLAFVVQRAVGQDIQDYAQDRLFGPIGIPKDSWFWLRDRAGNSYGHAHLFVQPERFARIGVLLDNGGRWNGREIVPADYIDRMRRATPTNGCYGFMVITNEGDTCTTAGLPRRRVLDHPTIPSAPRDLYSMAGAFHQNNFVIPSLDIVVSWTGFGGDWSLDPQALITAKPGDDLYHEFFRRLMRGVKDLDYVDPGPYPAEPIDPRNNPEDYADPKIAAGALGVGPYAPPGCAPLYCEGSPPAAGPGQYLPQVVRSIPGATRTPR